MSRRVAVALGVLALSLLALVLWLEEPRTPSPRPQVAESAEPAPEASVANRMAALRVRVTSGGQPVPGAAVVVEQDQPLLVAPVASALTGGDGVAALSGVPFGNWRLLVVHPELARHRRKLEIVAERMELEIALERGVRIEGVVVDASGRGVAGATVRVLSAESDAEHGKQQTSSSGAFAIAGLDVGSYRLYAHTGRHRPRYEGPLGLPEHGQVRRVTIRLEEGRTLSGRVVDARGAPVVGAHVGAADEGSAFVSSDEQGRFELAGLADAPTNVFATAPGFGPTHVRAVHPGGKGIEIVLLQAASIEGDVLLAAPARSVMVSLCRHDAHFAKELCVARQRYEPPERHFVLQNLPSGAHDLVVEADGHATTRVPVSLAPGQNFTVPLIKLALNPIAR